ARGRPALRRGRVAALRPRDARALPRSAIAAAARSSPAGYRRPKRGSTMRTMMFGTLAAAASLAALGAAPAAAQPGACDRECLEGFVDRYLDAMVDNDVGAVPFEDNARFTEHGQLLELGDGLWN